MSSVALPLTVASENAATPAFRLGHRPALDGIRGLAVTFVFLYHVSKFAFEFKPGLIAAGFLGVDVFFVLSGFLITALLLEEWEGSSRINLLHFYARRFFRLIPALVLFLSCLCLYVGLTKSPTVAKDTYWTAIYSLGYAANWISAFRIAPIAVPLGHMWSLAIEEQFYLLWPALLLFLLKRKVSRGTLVFGVAALIILVSLHRTSLSGAYAPRIYSASDTRADSLLAGCLAAMLVVWRMLPTSRGFKAALSAISFSCALLITAYLQNFNGLTESTLYTFGFSVFALAVAILLIQLTTNPPRMALAILEAPPLVWIGKLSYSIYLWHLPICIILAPLPFPAPIRAALMLAATLILASASYYLIERPFLRIKKRFAPSPSIACTSAIVEASRHR